MSEYIGIASIAGTVQEASIGTLIAVVGLAATIIGIITTIGTGFFKMGALSQKVNSLEERVHDMETDLKEVRRIQNEQAVTLGSIHEIGKNTQKAIDVLFKKIDSLVVVKKRSDGD